MKTYRHKKTGKPELIDKTALVAEIEKRIKKYATIDVGDSDELESLYGAKCHALISILTFIDTLEVKEVDLEKELKNLIGNVGQCDRKLAKYFFELGIKAQKGE